MENFFQFVRSRLILQQKREAEHPEAGVLAAFAERSLSRGEKAEVWSHLAHCTACRAIVASAYAMEENGAAAERSSARSRWWTWRWAAAGAAACLIASVVIWRPGSFREPTMPTPVTVKKRASMPVPNGPLQNGVSPSPAASHQAAASKAAEHAPARSPRQPAKRPAVARRTTVSRATPTPEPRIDVMAGARASVEAQGFQQFVATSPVTPALVLPQTAGSKPRPAFRAFVPAAEITGSTLWSLDAPADGVMARGAVKRSDDGGKTWHSVAVDEHSRFFALSSRGSDIWVGGAEGALFHSTDGGLHWTRVPVADESGPITGTITHIEARSAESVQVKVAHDGNWVTDDGGLHWRRE